MVVNESVLFFSITVVLFATVPLYTSIPFRSLSPGLASFTVISHHGPVMGNVVLDSPIAET